MTDLEALNQKLEQLYYDKVGNEDYDSIWSALFYEESSMEFTVGIEVLKVDFLDAFDRGDGNPMYVVFKVNDRYYQKHGYYSSWDSHDWDGELIEVKPIKVERTEYVPV